MDPETSYFETEMNRGFLQILVLAMLEKDMYGYSMVRTIRELGYEVEENTLYPLLRRLEKNSWVKSKWDVSEDRPRKFYGITDAGRSLRTELLDIWKKQDKILKKIMGRPPDHRPGLQAVPLSLYGAPLRLPLCPHRRGRRLQEELPHVSHRL